MILYISNPYQNETILIQIIAYLCIFTGCVRILPQLLKIFYTKSGKDISLISQTITAVATFLWFIYGLLVGDATVYIGSFIQMTLSIFIIILKFYYRNKSKDSKRLENEELYCYLKLQKQNKE